MSEHAWADSGIAATSLHAVDFFATARVEHGVRSGCKADCSRNLPSSDRLRSLTFVRVLFIFQFLFTIWTCIPMSNDAFRDFLAALGLFAAVYAWALVG